MNEPNIGTVVTVIGPVVDIRFKAGQLPNLLNAIEVMNNGQKLTLEVAQHVGDDIVRCIAMSSTDGLMRGVDAVDTGAPISVPVGNETLGRIFNLLGEAVDNKPTPVTEERWPIHRPAPSLEEQGGTTEILETGIKVIDLICPYVKGVRRRRRGQDRFDHGVYPEHRPGAQRPFGLCRRRRENP